jgi:hypothetical protein
MSRKHRHQRQFPQTAPDPNTHTVAPPETDESFSETEALPCPQLDPDLPYWLPSGDSWNELPREIRDAIPRVLSPAYRQFVLDAPNQLERSLGLTLVHLLWLEVCDHVRMALAVADPSSLAATLANPDRLIGRHLNLITAKCRAELLLKFRRFNSHTEQPTSNLESRQSVDQHPSQRPLPVPSSPKPTYGLEPRQSVDQHSPPSAPQIPSPIPDLQSLIPNP